MSELIKIHRFRKLTDLTNDEIKQIINDLFHPINIGDIAKYYKYQEIVVSFTWDWNDEIIEDDIKLSVPSINDGGLSADFTLNAEDYLRYNQFLLAKGVNPYLKDNPYLEDKK